MGMAVRDHLGLKGMQPPGLSRRSTSIRPMGYLFPELLKLTIHRQITAHGCHAAMSAFIATLIRKVIAMPTPIVSGTRWAVENSNPPATTGTILAQRTEEPPTHAAKVAGCGHKLNLVVAFCSLPCLTARDRVPESDTAVIFGRGHRHRDTSCLLTLPVLPDNRARSPTAEVVMLSQESDAHGSAIFDRIFLAAIPSAHLVFLVPLPKSFGIRRTFSMGAQHRELRNEPISLHRFATAHVNIHFNRRRHIVSRAEPL